MNQPYVLPSRQPVHTMFIKMFASFPHFLPMLIGLVFAGAMVGAVGARKASAADDATARAQKVDALLSQMTLDEKIGQMTQVDMAALTNKSDVQKYFLGSVLSGGNSDPPDESAKGWLQNSEEFQAWALKTRLKIPIIYGIDAVHGHNNVDGAVIFPHHIGMGATRNPALVEAMGRVTAEEVTGTGIRWAFGPCVAVVQNEHWGRTYESFGDSPKLVADLGAAEVRGFQGKNLADPTSVLASVKHYLGDGGTQGGIDQGNTVCDEATLRRLYLPPYQAAVKAGALNVMVSYSSWNGLKMHANKYLITDVLKGELGFKGFTVSDWAAIDQISPDYKTCIDTSINAGLDMIMIPNGIGKTNTYVDFITFLKELVGEGKVPQARIDDAVRRILDVKFQLGIFENTQTDPALTEAVGSAEHRAVARDCVRQSLVLLKNSKHALPLAKNLKRLAVVGEAADNLGIQCGGWTIDWQGRLGEVTKGGTTILAAIRKTVDVGTEVNYSADGSSAVGADAVIVVVGEKPYAEMKGDTNDVSLPAASVALIKKAKESGAPVVTLLLSGRPMILGDALEASDALVACWLPGTEGQGVADVIFGDYKPTGKLPRIWVSDNEQISNPPKGVKQGKPLFPFGYGLTYK